MPRDGRENKILITEAFRIKDDSCEQGLFTGGARGRYRAPARRASEAPPTKRSETETDACEDQPMLAGFASGYKASKNAP